MDDLAAILGMSKKTIYNVFSDKNSLFLDMVDYLFDYLCFWEKRKSLKTAIYAVSKAF